MSYPGQCWPESMSHNDTEISSALVHTVGQAYQNILILFPSVSDMTFFFFFSAAAHQNETSAVSNFGVSPHAQVRISIRLFLSAVKPVCNDHPYNKIYYLWFI